MNVEPLSSFSSPFFLWSQREKSELCAMNGDWWLRDPVEDSECTTVENSNDDNAGSLAKKLKSYMRRFRIFSYKHFLLICNEKEKKKQEEEEEKKEEEVEAVYKR
ncbi:hypothetical protein PUN28_002211 [Cardiocondyla obscurior]|uniref:Uncharacterized protein n=1 Tax=Cardiocondyla obscurior TaxID=286306 RepID=A0AAW2GT36_9HYME